MLIAIANGCYCGGGVKGVPYCKLDDGLMDVSVVNDMSRRFFMALFPSYSKGVHMEKKQIRDNDVIRYTKEKTLTVIANGEVLDGAESLQVHRAWEPLRAMSSLRLSGTVGCVYRCFVFFAKCL